ncbi:TRAP transporter small permease [uncultured Cohaesibacter sp.]|uniref:TRAP transporter small permease n=1 Tax=uncultured Cohaesibacter sp. TaxID=1002546 RepID=UPI0029C8E7B1|nr:TRAP transporter small permease [uncultured Cohaesibacter sp.]
MYERVGKWLNRVDALLVVICIALIVMMTIVMTMLVFTRNFLDFSFPWSEEITRFMMIWLAFLGAAILVHRDDHIALDFLPVTLRGGARFCLMLFLRILTLFAMGLLFWQAIQILEVRGRTVAPALGISLIWIYAAIPVSAALMIVFQAYRIWTDWRIFRYKEA